MEDKRASATEKGVYSVAVVDDSAEDARELLGLLRSSRHADRLDMRSFSSTGELEAAIAAEGYPDLVFMDICLSEGPREGAPTGIDEVERLFAGTFTQVVYVSGYGSYHTQAYRTEHACYVSKPLNQGDVDEALERAIGRLLARSDRPIGVRVQGTERVLRPKDIRYLESSRRLVRIHMRDEVIETYGKLADYQRNLPERFVRCHQSFIVNLDCIEYLGAASARISGGGEIPVSRRHRTELRDALISHIRG